jgi:hypothetical protein
VLQLQKALEIAHQQNDEILSPGVVDGVWGQNTSASFTSWQHQQDARMGATELAFPIGNRSHGPVYLYPAPYSVLYSLAEIYDAQHGTSQQPTRAAMVQQQQSLAPAPPSWTFLGQPWWVWLLIGLGAAGVGGGLWWYYSKKKHR